MLTLIKENEKGKTYQADGFKICYRKKDTISGDNDINVAEEIYLITGSAKTTIKDKTWACKTPEEIHIPAKTYHKIEALTDISFVLYEKQSFSGTTQNSSSSSMDLDSTRQITKTVSKISAKDGR